MKSKGFKIYGKAMTINSIYLYLETFVQIYIATKIGGIFNLAVAGNTNVVIETGIKFLIVITVVIIFQWFLSNYIKLLNERSSTELKKYIFNSFLLSKFQRIERFSSGEVISRLQKDIEMINSLFKNSYVIVFTSILSIFTYFIILSKLNIILATIILIAAIIPVISPIILEKIFSKVFLDMREIEELTSNTLMETIKGMEQIKLNNLYAFFKEKFHYCMKLYLKQGLKSESTIAIQDGLEQCFDKIGHILIYIVFAYYIFKGDIDAGDVVKGIFISRQIITAMMEALREYINVGKSKVSFKRIEEILEEENEIGTAHINYIEVIEVRDLAFSYDGGNRVLNNLSLTINKGDKIAILGGNGSGKSTLSKILLKLYNEYEGHITINNEELRNIRSTSYRSKICWCPQHASFYFEKVEENLYFSENVDKGKVKTFLDRFKLLSDIMDKNWYELSGGQKQKLSLIRALSKEGDVLILDEPSNYLDKEGIDELKNLLRDEDRTIILITHNKDLLEITNKSYELKYI